MEEQCESFLVYCKEWIKEHIEGYIGQTFYGCDLGITLTEGPNCDGSCTYSRYEAVEYLKEWWWEAADYFEYEKSEFGLESIHNPFDNPECYMVCMLIEGVNDLIAQCEVIDKNWNDKFELTEEIAQQICEEIEDFDIRWTE